MTRPLINPNNYVPALDHSGKILIEALVIMHYLNEVFDTGGRLVPQDAYVRAWCGFGWTGLYVPFTKR